MRVIWLAATLVVVSCSAVPPPTVAPTITVAPPTTAAGLATAVGVIRYLESLGFEGEDRPPGSAEFLASVLENAGGDAQQTARFGDIAVEIGVASDDLVNISVSHIPASE
jgi:hypothetical protein